MYKYTNKGLVYKQPLICNYCTELGVPPGMQDYLYITELWTWSTMRGYKLDLCSSGEDFCSTKVKIITRLAILSAIRDLYLSM